MPQTATPPGSSSSAALAFIEALRPAQWLKNGFVFAPLVFAGAFLDVAAAGRTALAFAAFCLTASAVYLFNDLADAAADRAHPKKRNRPVASGRLPAAAAWAALVPLALGGLALAYSVGPYVAAAVGAYVIVNLSYSLRLKHAVILDVFAIAAGFVLRVEAGALAAGVPASSWLLVCTSMLALFLGFSKRRYEVSLIADLRAVFEASPRKVLAEYSPAFLDKMMNLVEAITVIVYLMYVLDADTEARHGRGMLFTVPFVLYGIFRYQYLVYHRRSADNPTDTLLTDVPLLLSVLGWIAVAGFVSIQ